MRDKLRALRLIMTTAFRASPVRTVAVLVLTIASRLSIVVAALWLKFLADAALRGDGAEAARAAVVLAVLLVGELIAAVGGFTLRTGLDERTGRLLDERMMELAAGVPGIEHFERADYLDEMELLRTQRNRMSQAVSSVVESIATAAQVTGTVALLVTVHPALVMLPLFAIPSLWATGRADWLRDKTAEAMTPDIRLSSHLYALATDDGAAKELRIFGIGDEVMQRHQRLWRGVDQAHDRTELRALALSGLGWFVFAVGYIGGLVVVVREALSGRASPGDVLLALTLARQLNEQLTGAAQMVGWVTMVLTTVRRYLWLIDYATAATRHIAAGDVVEPPARLVEGIRFEDVSFRYPGTERDTLSGVNVSIPAGSTVAIVGDNGAGKTTLVKLLCRFYEPTSGRIIVDGTDLARFDALEWRTRMAAGFQDFAKFEFLAGETVGVGDLPSISDDAVTAALERAHASDVVHVLPSGLATQLGKQFDDGVELSGGQWQKLALGRAMMRTAPLLLVLDEPTASLDAQTENALFERYAGAARRVATTTGAITVLVSHRFSTVRMADLIIVVDAGGVTEAGSHDELMARAGLYAELFELQARAYR